MPGFTKARPSLPESPVSDLPGKYGQMPPRSTVSSDPAAALSLRLWAQNSVPAKVIDDDVGGRLLGGLASVDQDFWILGHLVG